MFFSLFLLSLTEIFGVNETQQSKYLSHIDEKAGTFRCFSDNKVIPLSKFNDNYADCSDKSDEPSTSQGPSHNFFCRNKNYISYEIPRWSVGDNICDCCDGSDEIGNVHVKCPNTCADLESERKSLVSKLEKTIKGGIEKRSSYLRQGTSSQSEGARKKEKYQGKIDKYEKKIQKIKDGKKTPTPTPSPIVPDEYADWENDYANHTDKNASKAAPEPAAEPILKQKKKLPILVRIWKFLFFVNRDDIAFSEVFMKPKDGRIKLYKSKIEGWKEKINKVNAASGKLKEDTPKELIPLYKKEFTLDDFKLSFLDNIQYGSNSIGRYNSVNMGEDGQTPVSTKYTGGRYCWEIKSGASTELFFQCGNKDRLVDVVEASVCNYRGVFATPAVCTQQDLDKLYNMTVPELKELRDRMGKK